MNCDPSPMGGMPEQYFSSWTSLEPDYRDDEGVWYPWVCPVFVCVCCIGGGHKLNNYYTEWGSLSHQSRN